MPWSRFRNLEFGEAVTIAIPSRDAVVAPTYRLQPSKSC